jgi:phosphoglucosamine mutase
MERYPQVLENVHVSDRAGLAVSAAIADAVHAAEAELGEAGRVLVRASGTEPLVRVMVEAADESQARTIVERIAGVVRAELG